MSKSLHIVTQVCLQSNNKKYLKPGFNMWTFFYIFLRLRLKVMLLNLSWEWLRIGPKFLERIPVKPELEWKFSHECKFFDENPLQSPCLSFFFESRLHSFLSRAFPMLFKSLHTWSPREVSIPGESCLKYREIQYCTSLSKIIFISFLSWKNLEFLAFYLESKDLLFLT